MVLEQNRRTPSAQNPESKGAAACASPLFDVIRAARRRNESGDTDADTALENPGDAIRAKKKERKETKAKKDMQVRCRSSGLVKKYRLAFTFKNVRRVKCAEEFLF